MNSAAATARPTCGGPLRGSSSAELPVVCRRLGRPEKVRTSSRKEVAVVYRTLRPNTRLSPGGQHEYGRGTDPLDRYTTNLRAPVPEEQPMWKADVQDVVRRRTVSSVQDASD